MQKLIAMALAVLSTVTSAQAPAASEGLQVTFVAICDETKNAEWWYRVPGHMPPAIYPTDEVVLGQSVSLTPFFSGYQLDDEGNANITFELQQVTPLGLKVELGDFVGVQSKIQNPAWIQLATALPRVTFDSPMLLGPHRFIATAHDHVGGTTATQTVEINVLTWDPAKTSPEASISPNWMTGHYRNPRPDLAYMLFRHKQPLDVQRMAPGVIDWAGLNFHRHALADSALALDAIKSDFAEASRNDKRKTALLFLLLEDKERFQAIKDQDAKVATWASAQPLPDPYGTLQDPAQLDMLWTEFLATGRYTPVRRIIDALELVTFAGALEAYPTSDQTEADRASAIKDAIFQSAVWSLKSNAEQHDRVTHYLAWAAENETFDEEVATVLAEILESL